MRFFLFTLLFIVNVLNTVAFDLACDAKWIWVSEEQNTEVSLARKVFQLDELPQEAILKITASDIYQVYINGVYIQRGPARSAAHHQSYDVIDILPYLQNNKNSIAVRTVFEPGATSYQFNSRAGLLVQIELDNKKIVSDRTWQMVADKSWDDKSPVISRFQRDVTDRIDMRNYLHHWNQLDYDDSKWENAIELIRNEGWPAHPKGARPSIHVNPWTKLVARDIPYLKDSLFTTPQLILTQTYLEEPKSIVSQKVALSGHLDKKITKQYTKNHFIKTSFSSDVKGQLFVFDFGKMISGLPTLNLSGEAGTKVSVLCAPYILDNTFTATLVDAKNEDQIILSGNTDQWEASYFKPCRYMAIYIQNNGGDICINQLGLRGLSYPFKMMGEMKSKDAPWVSDFYSASAKTIDVCTTDALTDNYRERRQYSQTGYYGALGNYYTFADFDLQKRYLVQVAQEQMADGIMPAYAPVASKDYMVILDSNCFWIKSLWNYYLYSGDKETVAQLLPTAIRLLDLLNGFTNQLGLIENPPYSYWLDHAINDRNGANFTFNAHYLEALENYNTLLKHLNSDAKNYEGEASLLRSSLQTHFWNDDKGVFVDALINGKQSELISEHANAMALALKIANDVQGKRLAEIILSEPEVEFVKGALGMTMVTPAMSYYLHKGLCEYGYTQASFKLFNTRFKHMLNADTNQTLWEEWWLNGTARTGKFSGTKTRSDAQTESAFPPALFAEYLFGLKPIEPGLKQWTLRNIDSGVNHLEGTFRSGESHINLSWEKGKQNTLEITIPNDVSVKLDVLSLSVDSIISINGNKASMHNDILILSKGNYSITY